MYFQNQLYINISYQKGFLKKLNLFQLIFKKKIGSDYCIGR